MSVVGYWIIYFSSRNPRSCIIPFRVVETSPNHGLFHFIVPLALILSAHCEAYEFISSVTILTSPLVMKFPKMSSGCTTPKAIYIPQFAMILNQESTTLQTTHIAGQDNHHQKFHCPKQNQFLHHQKHH